MDFSKVLDELQTVIECVKSKFVKIEKEDILRITTVFDSLAKSINFHTKYIPNLRSSVLDVCKLLLKYSQENEDYLKEFIKGVGSILFVVDSIKAYDDFVAESGSFLKLLIDNCTFNYTRQSVKDLFKLYKIWVMRSRPETVQLICVKDKQFPLQLYRIVENTLQIDLQLILMEIIWRLLHFTERNKSTSHLWDIFAGIGNDGNLHKDLRSFLSFSNEKLRNMFTMKCDRIYINDKRISGGQKTDDIWIDLNLDKLTIICEKSCIPNYYQELYLDNWVALSFLTSDIRDFVYKLEEKSIEANMLILEFEILNTLTNLYLASNVRPKKLRFKINITITDLVFTDKVIKCLLPKDDNLENNMGEEQEIKDEESNFLEKTPLTPDECEYLAEDEVSPQFPICNPLPSNSPVDFVINPSLIVSNSASNDEDLAVRQMSAKLCSTDHQKQIALSSTMLSVIFEETHTLDDSEDESIGPLSQILKRSIEKRTQDKNVSTTELSSDDADDLPLSVLQNRMSNVNCKPVKQVSRNSEQGAIKTCDEHSELQKDISEESSNSMSSEDSSDDSQQYEDPWTTFIRSHRQSLLNVGDKIDDIEPISRPTIQISRNSSQSAIETCDRVSKLVKDVSEESPNSVSSEDSSFMQFHQHQSSLDDRHKIDSMINNWSNAVGSTPRESLIITKPSLSHNPNSNTNSDITSNSPSNGVELFEFEPSLIDTPPAIKQVQVGNEKRKRKSDDHSVVDEFNKFIKRTQCGNCSLIPDLIKRAPNLIDIESLSLPFSASTSNRVRILDNKVIRSADVLQKKCSSCIEMERLIQFCPCSSDSD